MSAVVIERKKNLSSPQVTYPYRIYWCKLLLPHLDLQHRGRLRKRDNYRRERVGQEPNHTTEKPFPS
jgi:hypothetical protein